MNTAEVLALVKKAREEGERPNLRGANLSGAILSGAILSGAILSGADLSGANLSDANLRGADLNGAILIRANLSGAILIRAILIRANLSGAKLSGADLNGADLNHAYLSGAKLNGANLFGADLSDAKLSGSDLSGANLFGANLIRANLSGAIGIDLALARCSILPEGAFDAWKQCVGGAIVKLRVPANAKRSHGAERKCRAEFVKVLEVYNADGNVIEEACSNYDPSVVYKKGATIRAHAWCEDRWETCAPGIHFFLTRLEAEAYKF